MRNDKWLEEQLKDIWISHFPDIEPANDIKIRFGRNSKTRLGSIALRKKEQERRQLFRHEVRGLRKESAVSIITISGYFRNFLVPEDVVRAIISHEFCHYIHGFNSLKQKKFLKPHQGGVIDCELKERGLGEALKTQKKWIKENWKEFTKVN